MNTMNTSTGFSGFQLKTGQSLRVIPPLTALSADATAEQTTAHEIVTCVALDIKEAQDNLLAAKIRQAYHTNEHCTPEDIYKVGDLVMLSTKNHHHNYKHKGKTHVAKFMPRNNGTPSHTPSLNDLNTHSNCRTTQTPSLASTPTY